MATQLATQDEQPRQLSDRREAYAIMKDKARMFASSPLIPESLRGNNYDVAVANCLIALELASVMNEAPLVVMQNIHIVKGKAGFAAQYMIARANSSGVFKGRIGWRIEGTGPSLAVTAHATLADTGEEVSFTASMAMATAEGWTSNSKYKTMPEVMLRYRSATFLVRFYAPDVMLGYHTVEEYQDVASAPPPPMSRPLTATALLGHEEPRHEPEGPTDEDRGDLFDGNQDHPARAAADRLRMRLMCAKTPAVLETMIAESQNERDAMPDEMAAEMLATIGECRGKFDQ